MLEQLVEATAGKASGAASRAAGPASVKDAGLDKRPRAYKIRYFCIEARGSDGEFSASAPGINMKLSSIFTQRTRFSPSASQHTCVLFPIPSQSIVEQRASGVESMLSTYWHAGTISKSQSALLLAPATSSGNKFGRQREVLLSLTEPAG